MSYCSSCGTLIPEGIKFCQKCGTEAQPSGSVQGANANMGVPPQVDTHLAKAILATLLCCLPLGIVAIIHAASVNSKLMAGDYNGARIASEKANTWGNWSIGLGLAVSVLYILVALAGNM